MRKELSTFTVDIGACKESKEGSTLKECPEHYKFGGIRALDFYGSIARPPGVEDGSWRQSDSSA
jgi:hypothetical protein